ncbi:MULTISPECIES: 4-hydroxy-tetrahydrodipicolinate reductase [Alphaproteobacteria]|uniref:4-hydroxy-tetrahydrodipicolinate reductase n=2 Tax=Alphaproteobacteria TaxID=28211 RepID=A0A512HP18_9HYPH|nr:MULTISPECIES: dihydrodipicolinate reductase C-terminal domain-containing protein [Alphaproteobacteria]GEO87197.1 4-hydroxy-tetrahydrodipicolinate reductase [Ciceribacter naphthalenivorans]GLR23073.1 4-hydroxy-tetrahydrodipicolinate reductase [Ciceribacter naphthalenivorans]GLT05929.1 4-hydroxy-tetrahydrodipicolinate reductase [Sphingomonas psychrolutea]
MRIGIMGASGRVGTRLVELIVASPGLELAAALVSPGSRLAGTPVAGGSIEYRPADKAINSHCDVMIDFSTPAASLALQESIGTKAIPMVIGTTGFTGQEDAKLSEHCAQRPMLVSANFARGFEAFRRATLGFARQMPAAEPAVAETYHVRKKPDPSGTSRLLADQLFEARSAVMKFAAQRPAIAVHREGDTVGINTVRFDMGSAEVVMTYRVHALAAYAEGALAAAQWLVSKPRQPGRYSLADSFNEND